ncbi:hypothetical protein LOTGIDRAFT_172836 [Lottia gigantea]|uniref:NXPE C-terminal domain-containing protein n=1 Tax=Lottia gigantea TaxID=225164 RepID=V4CG19_LOTGI|nr:hypothetical protein LOTGIDRAFT_172836 [Lottia gigantea]ESP01000.1 hypothetical protein LOTGIDRAFT_172836 [Lottia gigantea]
MIIEKVKYYKHKIDSDINYYSAYKRRQEIVLEIIDDGKRRSRLNTDGKTGESPSTVSYKKPGKNRMNSKGFDKALPIVQNEKQPKGHQTKQENKVKEVPKSSSPKLKTKESGKNSKQTKSKDLKKRPNDRPTKQTNKIEGVSKTISPKSITKTPDIRENQPKPKTLRPRTFNIIKNRKTSELFEEIVSQESETFSLKKFSHCIRVNRKNCAGPQNDQISGKKQKTYRKVGCYPVEVTLKPLGRFVNELILPKHDMHPFELETLYDPDFVDLNQTASVTNSVAVLLEPQKQFRVGDVIKVRIDLFDGSGKRRRIGGDDVRVWMKSKGEYSRVNGYVTDLKNGSYVANFNALWEGESTIYGALPNTREAIASMFKWYRQYKTLFYYRGYFNKDNVKELTMCSVFAQIPGYDVVCNFTAINYNHPFYCGCPLQHSLTCSHFVSLYDLDYTEIALNRAQAKYFNRDVTFRPFTSRIKLKILKGNNPRANLRNCSGLPVRETWDIKTPPGYYSGRELKPLKCENRLNDDSINQCLRNTTLFLYGDSTIRSWYSVLLKRYKCTIKVEGYKWYFYSECHKKEINSTLIWAPQSFPFLLGGVGDSGNLKLKSVEIYLNEIPSNSKTIFVIHLYAHFIRQHYSVFRNHIRSLKIPLRDALKRNKELKIAIKGPHIFYGTVCPTSINDYFGKLYTDIILTELAEFKDSVWFLNYWDTTTAKENIPLHPGYFIVQEDIRYLLGLVCGKPTH